MSLTVEAGTVGTTVRERSIMHVPAAQRSVQWAHDDGVSDAVPPALDGADVDAAASVSVSVPPGSVLVPHRHPVDEAYVLLVGEMEVADENRTFAVRAGDFVLIPAGVTHGWRNLSSESARMLFLLFCPTVLDAG